jgi:K+-transporting ATPase KdpF subunit
LLSAWASSPCRSVTPSPANGFEENVAALVSAGLLVYLTYALLRPERF